MIITTTQSIEGYTIKEYRGIVFGEVVAGIDFIKDFSAGIRNIFGGRSATYENELIEARSDALNEMEQHALQAGANAVVGVKLDYETLGEGGMMMVIASGTAVVI